MKKNNISKEILCAEYEAVYRYALSLCHNEAEAQDIIQETFLKALNAYSLYRGDSSLYTWLCSIAKNLWINKCKKANKEVVFDSLEDVTSHENIEQCLLNKDFSLYIHRVLHKLDEPYKEVFTLRTFGELSFYDIANLFSKSESWARVTYHRAKKKIIERLRKDGVYEP